MESRPFAAVCYCNRAAAYKALGQITDAIADCSLSIALDGNYLKVSLLNRTSFVLLTCYNCFFLDVITVFKSIRE